MKVSSFTESKGAEWSIDPKTGHCAHPSGIVTYFCDQPTLSGAIRCIGPFIHQDLTDRQIAGELEKLCKLLESTTYFPNSYVVFGAYQEEPDFREHEFPLLNSIVGFIPCLGLRGQILSNDASWGKEWSNVDASHAIHRSGIAFGSSTQSNIDIAVVHPTTFNLDLETLHKTAILYGLQQKQKGSKAPIVWTPTDLAS